MKSLLLRLYDRSSRWATIRGSSRPKQDYLLSLELLLRVVLRTSTIACRGGRLPRKLGGRRVGVGGR